MCINMWANILTYFYIHISDHSIPWRIKGGISNLIKNSNFGRDLQKVNFLRGGTMNYGQQEDDEDEGDMVCF